MPELTDLRISLVGKCPHCGHAVQESYRSTANGRPANIQPVKQAADGTIILQLVSEATGVSELDITYGRRHVATSLARHIYWWVLREGLGLSWIAIARPTKHDHTTVIHAHKRIQERYGRPIPDDWFEEDEHGVVWVNPLEFTAGIENLSRQLLQNTWRKNK